MSEPEGLYNPSARYAFTNITDEVFTSKWGGVSIIVNPHETIEVSYTTPIIAAGEALAHKMCKEMVDKIMIGDAKVDEEKHKDTPFYRSPKGMSLGVPAARQIWEEQILRPMSAEEESPQLKSIREQVKSELLGDMNRKSNIADEQSPATQLEFVDMVPNVKVDKKLVEKKPARVKKITV